MQFIDGKRIKILKAETFQGITGTLGQIIIHIHRFSVDAMVAAVNMADGFNDGMLRSPTGCRRRGE